MSDRGNFKVRCIGSVALSRCKSGDTFEFNNGITTWNNGAISGFYSNIEDLNDNNQDTIFELVPDQKQFTKSDLRTGMRAKLSDGSLNIVMLNTEDGRDIITDGAYTELINYNEQLERAGGFPNLEILEVYAAPPFPKILDLNCKGKLLYKRPEPRKISKAEAEKILSEQFEEKVEIEG